MLCKKFLILTKLYSVSKQMMSLLIPLWVIPKVIVVSQYHYEESKECWVDPSTTLTSCSFSPNKALMSSTPTKKLHILIMRPMKNHLLLFPIMNFLPASLISLLYQKRKCNPFQSILSLFIINHTPNIFSFRQAAVLSIQSHPPQVTFHLMTPLSLLSLLFHVVPEYRGTGVTQNIQNTRALKV